MNSMLSKIFFAATALLAAATLLPAQDFPPASDSQRVWHISFPQDGGKVEVKVVDGKVSATQDGQPIPRERIKAQGDMIVVLAGDGSELLHVDSEGNLWATGFHPSNDWVQDFAIAQMSSDRVRIGVTLGAVDAPLASHLDVDSGRSVMITEVMSDGPAARAGLRKYDVVVAINGHGDASEARLRQAVQETGAGGALQLALRRGAHRMDVTIAPEKDQAGGWRTPMAFSLGANVDLQAREDLDLETLVGANAAQSREKFLDVWKTTIAEFPAAEELEAARKTYTESLEALAGARAQWNLQLPAEHTWQNLVPMANGYFRQGEAAAAPFVWATPYLPIGTSPPSSGTDVSGRLAAIEERLAAIEALLKGKNERVR
ncbi:MAG TPA: PDZ domain-containing protein [Planctomycetota bacterium]